MSSLPDSLVLSDPTTAKCRRGPNLSAAISRGQSLLYKVNHRNLAAERFDSALYFTEAGFDLPCCSLLRENKHICCAFYSSES
jgi:hypothetical protein